MAQTTSSEAFDKDIEIQSVHSSSTEQDDDAIKSGENEGVMKEKEDIEAYAQDPEIRIGEKGKEGAVTRTSTKSSWKDPGPPPDGGKEAWIQG